MKATIYKSNGEEVSVTPANGETFTLKELRDIVHGYIEIITLSNPLVMIVNEEGIIEELPMNVKASQIAASYHRGSFIVGDVLVCNSSMIE